MALSFTQLDLAINKFSIPPKTSCYQHLRDITFLTNTIWPSFNCFEKQVQQILAKYYSNHIMSGSGLQYTITQLEPKCCLIMPLKNITDYSLKGIQRVMEKKELKGCKTEEWHSTLTSHGLVKALQGKAAITGSLCLIHASKPSSSKFKLFFYPVQALAGYDVYSLSLDTEKTSGPIWLIIPVKW